MGGQLLPILQQVQNKSGSIPIAPSSLMKLKQSIQGVPFQIHVPGMSQVVSSGNILGGLSSLLAVFSSFANMGNLQSILGGLLNGTANLSQLTGALGGAGSLGAALLTFGGGPQLPTTSSTPTSQAATGTQEAGQVDDSSIG